MSRSGSASLLSSFKVLVPSTSKNSRSPQKVSGPDRRARRYRRIVPKERGHHAREGDIDMGGSRESHAGGWTEDRTGALKKLWLEGLSASQIAKQLGGGVTRNGVIGKVHRLGLSGRAAPSQPARATFRPSRPKSRPPLPVTAKQALPAPTAPATAPAPPPEPKEQLPGTAVLLTLGEHMCKWPIGDPATAGFSFCGRRASEVYCVEHARVAYQPQVKRGATDLARSLRRYI